VAAPSEPHENRSQERSAGAPRFSSAPLAYVVSALLLCSAFVALLWVPSYAHVKPTLGGFPFFYWYSLMWLLINAACQWIVYQLLVAGPRRRRREGSAR
jgi:uncharacterized RDD family membrane protein YckC